METKDQAIGTAHPAILAGVTIETDSSALSTTRSSAIVRLDDRQLAAAEALANSPLPILPPCDDDSFAKAMRSLSMLPRRGDDEATGKLRVAIYRRMLGQHSKEAIMFMTERAIATLDWFPTPKQCLDILAQWKRNDGDVHNRARAAAMVRDELRARFDDTMAALERRDLDQDQIDALSPRMRDIGVERGFLRLHDDGIYRARPVPVPTNG